MTSGKIWRPVLDQKNSSLTPTKRVWWRETRGKLAGFLKWKLRLMPYSLKEKTKGNGLWCLGPKITEAAQRWAHSDTFRKAERGSESRAVSSSRCVWNVTRGFWLDDHHLLLSSLSFCKVYYWYYFYLYVYDRWAFFFMLYVISLTTLRTRTRKLYTTRIAV